MSIWRLKAGAATYLEGNVRGELNNLKAVAQSTVCEMKSVAQQCLPREKQEVRSMGECSGVSETYSHSAVISMSDTKIKPVSNFHFWTIGACTFLL